MKTPFYMTYPMQNLYQAEMEYEKDMERMKELYPREVKKILLCVEDRCDELEFEGSRIYDENPDRIMMEREILALYERLLKEGLTDDMSSGMQDNMNNSTRSNVDGGMQNSGNSSMRDNMDDGMRNNMNGSMRNNMDDGMQNGVRMQEYDSEDIIAPPCCKDFALYPPEGWELPEEKGLETMSPPPGDWRRRGPGRPGGPNRPGEPCRGWLCNMVGVLFQDEVYRRRCRYRRCHRWW